MRTLTTDIENTSVVEEPQLAMKFNVKTELQNEEEKGKSTLNMLSLFSGCGGMDLGFEGNFSGGPLWSKVRTV